MRAATTAPPTTSLCPPQYLVVECMTTSAPSASGCCRYGDAKVLSTARMAPASCATSASAAMSAMPSSGLVGVSTHTIFVCPGRIAARTASTSWIEVMVCSTPHGQGDLVEQPVGAAVRVGRHDDVVPGREQRPDQGVLAGQPGGEREAAAAVLQRGHARLERGPGGVGRAAVLVAAAQAADAVLLVRRHLVDRGDRPRRSRGPAPAPRGWRGWRSRWGREAGRSWRQG